MWYIVYAHNQLVDFMSFIKTSTRPSRTEYTAGQPRIYVDANGAADAADAGADCAVTVNVTHPQWIERMPRVRR